MNGAERDFAGRITGLANWPSTTEREVMQRRHKALIQHMGQRNDRDIGAAVTALIGCYRNGLKPGEDIRPVTAKYVKELAGLPTWACVRACDAIRHNKYPDCITYLPSTMRLREIAASYIETVSKEASDLFHILRAERLAPPPDENVRKRIGLGFQKLSDELHATAQADLPKRPQFTPYSAEQLRRMYPPREAPASDSEEFFVKQSEEAVA